MTCKETVLAAVLLAVSPISALADGGSGDVDSTAITGIMRDMGADAVRGRLLFSEKGCVLCHSVNGVGGEDAAPLDASGMQKHMNPFDLAAKMWAMAPYMIEAQEAEMGGQILFSGRELGDIVAFLHDGAEQHKFAEDTLPVYIREILRQGRE